MKNLQKEIELLHKIYNTLYLIPTKGQDTLYMAQILNSIIELIHMLELKHEIIEVVEIPINEIQEA